MNIYTSLADLPATPTVATIGNFDGVHRGHRWIIEQVNNRARALACAGRPVQSLAITFHPHPVRLLRPEAPHSLITPLPAKLTLLATTGVDATLVLPFDESLAQLSPEAFVREILLNACHIREIHEGADFRFGYRGAGDMTTLATLGRTHNFAVHPYPPLIFRGAPISSSRIRTLISAGDVSRARALLSSSSGTRPFTIRSTPARGRGYGTRYAVPTINLAPYAELLPAHGVYITTLTIGSNPEAGVILSGDAGTAFPATQSRPETFQAVTNVGVRPTFGQDSFAVESHLLDFHPLPLHEDTPLALTFLKRLRPEKRFPGPEALRTQIALDVRRARRYFALASRLTSSAQPYVR